FLSLFLYTLFYTTVDHLNGASQHRPINPSIPGDDKANRKVEKKSQFFAFGSSFDPTRSVPPVAFCMIYTEYRPRSSFSTFLSKGRTSRETINKKWHLSQCHTYLGIKHILVWCSRSLENRERTETRPFDVFFSHGWLLIYIYI